MLSPFDQRLRQLLVQREMIAIAELATCEQLVERGMMPDLTSALRGQGYLTEQQILDLLEELRVLGFEGAANPAALSPDGSGAPTRLRERGEELPPQQAREEPEPEIRVSGTGRTSKTGRAPKPPKAPPVHVRIPAGFVAPEPPREPLPLDARPRDMPTGAPSVDTDRLDDDDDVGGEPRARAAGGSGRRPETRTRAPRPPKKPPSSTRMLAIKREEIAAADAPRADGSTRTAAIATADSSEPLPAAPSTSSQFAPVVGDAEAQAIPAERDAARDRATESARAQRVLDNSIEAVDGYPPRDPFAGFDERGDGGSDLAGDEDGRFVTATDASSSQIPSAPLSALPADGTLPASKTGRGGPGSSPSPPSLASESRGGTRGARISTPSVSKWRAAERRAPMLPPSGLPTTPGSEPLPVADVSPDSQPISDDELQAREHLFDDEWGDVPEEAGAATALGLHKADAPASTRKAIDDAESKETDIVAAVSDGEAVRESDFALAGVATEAMRSPFADKVDDSDVLDAADLGDPLDGVARTSADSSDSAIEVPVEVVEGEVFDDAADINEMDTQRAEPVTAESRDAPPAPPSTRSRFPPLAPPPPLSRPRSKRGKRLSTRSRNSEPEAPAKDERRKPDAAAAAQSHARELDLSEDVPSLRRRSGRASEYAWPDTDPNLASVAEPPVVAFGRAGLSTDADVDGDRQAREDETRELSAADVVVADTRAQDRGAGDGEPTFADRLARLAMPTAMAEPGELYDAEDASDRPPTVPEAARADDGDPFANEGSVNAPTPAVRDSFIRVDTGEAVADSAVPVGQQATNDAGTAAREAPEDWAGDDWDVAVPAATESARSAAAKPMRADATDWSDFENDPSFVRSAEVVSDADAPVMRAVYAAEHGDSEPEELEELHLDTKSLMRQSEAPEDLFSGEIPRSDPAAPAVAADEDDARAELAARLPFDGAVLPQDTARLIPVEDASAIEVATVRGGPMRDGRDTVVDQQPPEDVRRVLRELRDPAKPKPEPVVVDTRIPGLPPAHARDESRMVGPAAHPSTRAMATPSLVGRTIGPLTFTRLLGAGGLGVVYEAQYALGNAVLDNDETSLGDAAPKSIEVAAKVVSPSLAADAHYRERLRHEIAIAAHLTHASVVRTYELIEEGEHVIIVSELVRGRTLRQVLNERSVLGEMETVEIARSVLRALDHAHARDLVHRAVRPENVFLCTTGAVKLVDFGLARETEGETATTLAGQLLIDPHNMAPEQARGEPVDGRADLYALGLTVYECITGARPFAAPTPNAVLVRVVTDEPPAPSEINARVSMLLEGVILKLIEKSPRDRYDAAPNALRALAAWTPELASSAESRRRKALDPIAPHPVMDCRIDVAAAANVLATAVEPKPVGHAIDEEPDPFDEIAPEVTAETVRRERQARAALTASARKPPRSGPVRPRVIEDPQPAFAHTPPPPRKDRSASGVRRSRWPRRVAVVIALLGVLGGAVAVAAAMGVLGDNPLQQMQQWFARLSGSASEGNNGASGTDNDDRDTDNAGGETGNVTNGSAGDGDSATNNNAADGNAANGNNAAGGNDNGAVTPTVQHGLPALRVELCLDKGSPQSPRWVALIALASGEHVAAEIGDTLNDGNDTLVRLGQVTCRNVAKVWFENVDAGGYHVPVQARGFRHVPPFVFDGVVDDDGTLRARLDGQLYTPAVDGGDGLVVIPPDALGVIMYGSDRYQVARIESDAQGHWVVVVPVIPAPDDGMGGEAWQAVRLPEFELRFRAPRTAD